LESNQLKGAEEGAKGESEGQHGTVTWHFRNKQTRETVLVAVLLKVWKGGGIGYLRKERNEKGKLKWGWA